MTPRRALVLLAAAIVLAGADQPTLPEVRRFHELWTPSAAGETEAARRRAHDYLMDLPDGRRVPVGRALLHDPDPAVSYMGANLLIQTGDEDEAIPTLTRLWVEHPEIGVGSDWLHADDQKRVARVTLAMNRDLLANLERYSGDQRRRAERYLMGTANGDEPFSRDKVEARLRDLEQQLRWMR